MAPPDRPALLLASSSPRRLELLAQMGVTPDAVFSPDIDETPHKGEAPRLYVQRMAQQKAAAARDHLPGAIILACDTSVVAGRRIIGPPTASDAEVSACLALLSGRRHTVYSSVCVIDTEGRARHRTATSTVQFKRLSAREIQAYIACGEGMGKAGGYAIQGQAARFITFMAGSYSGIVGLPLFETAALLRASGYGLD
jgi:septum formation protein